MKGKWELGGFHIFDSIVKKWVVSNIRAIFWFQILD